MLRRGSKTLLFAFLLLALGSECSIEPSENNYVSVHVEARLRVAASEYPHTMPWAGAQVRLRCVKDGGEREVIEGTTDAEGLFGTLIATFKVYREQPLWMEVDILGGTLPSIFYNEPWDPVLYEVVRAGVDQLLWHQIEHLMGEEYWWYPDVDVIVRPRGS
jgi:hypothetical protein